MRRANEAVVRERHPIPTVEEILHELNGSTVFSKLDLRMGFHQIELDEKSREITTFTTERGLYRYKRLMFGISSAPEKYQKIIRDALRKCDGVANIADDIIVHGRGTEHHDQRLFAVLDRLQELNLTLNKEKCEFRMSKLTFFGHVVTSRGIDPSEEKVGAIRDAEPPKSVSEARSFLGLVQYSAKFLPDLSSVAQPIQELVRKDTPFVWAEAQDRAFKELKRLITSSDTLAYFREDCRTRIVADASPVGLGAVLTQLQDNEWRVIAYASRSLSDVERRYSQTEREALGLVWACERFNLYTFGREFELETDHKPLEYIYSRTSKPSARVERWVLRLQAYNFKVVYRPGKTNIADALSRLNSTVQRDKGHKYDYVRYVVEASIPVALTPQEVERATVEDPELAEIKRCVRSGNWEDCKVSGYKHVSQELCVYGELLLRGTRIVVPQSLRNRVVQLAHEGHQGIVKTKCRLRTKVWWPGMDTMAEKVCKGCHGCQVTGGLDPPEPMSRAKPPSGPWQHLAADLMGPLPTGENILVVVDYFSRYYEMAVMKSTTSSAVVNAMLPMFARFGTPVSIKTDNGPQFVSEVFESFLHEHGIAHCTSPPLWPQANGEVERQNRTLLKALKVAQIEGKNWREEIFRFLTAYRSTPQRSTGVSPYFLMFGREMGTKLPELQRDTVLNEEVCDRDWENKVKGKDYSDSDRSAKESPVTTGDTVLVKGQKTDKLSPTFMPTPFKVISDEQGKVTVRNDDGVELQRSKNFVKQYESGAQDEVLTAVPSPVKSPAGRTLTVEKLVSSSPIKARPTRNIRKPARFDDYVPK